MFLNTKRISRIGMSFSQPQIRTYSSILASGHGAGSYSRIYKFEKQNPLPGLSDFTKILLETLYKTIPI
jgi:hypothetical protein